jgi:predicted transcriptional regulator
MTEITEEQVKASILEFLVKKRRWGSYYFPIDTLVNFLSRKIKRNSERVRNSMEQLVKRGYVLLHKKGKTISFNPIRGREIIEYIKRIV